MTWYRLADYGGNVNAGKDRNNAQARGWGPGWPNCQWDNWVVIEGGGVRMSINRKIAPLVLQLIKNTEAMGYDILSGQTWGSACRAIRGTSYPSNHSWGLAVDLNSLANVMASYFQCNIPPKVIRMWEDCGFFWGGRYSGRVDTMHLEYIGEPDDVAGHLAKAKTYEVEDEVRPKEWSTGDRNVVESIVESVINAQRDDIAREVRTDLLDFRVPLTEAQSKYFNGLTSITFRSLLIYGAMGGGPAGDAKRQRILDEILEAEARDLARIEAEAKAAEEAERA